MERTFHPSRRRAGFTLLELVVATTVLLILTLMIGALFRQATSAWDAGRVRGEGGSVARAIIGSVSRDLSTAIDGRAYDGGCLPNVSGNTLTFCCLKPVRGSSKLQVHKITYSGAVRTDEAWDGSQFKQIGDSVNFAESDADSEQFSLDSVEYKMLGMPKTAARGNWETTGAFPAHWLTDAAAGPAVKVRIRFTQEGEFSGVAVRSWGKNGLRDEDPASKYADDIVSR